jgi:hypothetical protein
MYVGIVLYGKNHVEEVTIEADNRDQASDIMASYVYKNYNLSLVPEAPYTGIVIDPSVNKVIKAEKELVTA